MSELIKSLLERNRQWARDVKKSDPQFFLRLAEQQCPQYLWIGCSDSRVPANQILGLLPGAVFVHRNVGNIVSQTDFNCLAVIQYAVDVLGIREIIVCGHYGCGAVSASMEGQRHGLIDNWLHELRVLYRDVRDELDAYPEGRRHGRLCELNVMMQARNVCQTAVVRRKWKEGCELTVHGVVYGIQNGLLKDLELNIDSAEQADAIMDVPVFRP